MTSSAETTGTEPAATIARAVTQALAGEVDVAAVYLFGSCARGDSGPESDVDLGVVFVERTVTPARFGTIADALAAAVARATGIERVDVVDLAAQGPIFAHNALLDGKLVFEGDRARRLDFVTDTVSRAIDFRPTYEIATRDKAGAMRRALRADDLVREKP